MLPQIANDKATKENKELLRDLDDKNKSMEQLQVRSSASWNGLCSWFVCCLSQMCTSQCALQIRRDFSSSSFSSSFTLPLPVLFLIQYLVCLKGHSLPDRCHDIQFLRLSLSFSLSPRGSSSGSRSSNSSFSAGNQQPPSGRCGSSDAQLGTRSEDAGKQEQRGSSLKGERFESNWWLSSSGSICWWLRGPQVQCYVVSLLFVSHSQAVFLYLTYLLLSFVAQGEAAELQKLKLQLEKELADLQKRADGLERKSDRQKVSLF